MENISLKRREVFFNNLLLLGLDKITLEKKHDITFHKDMFALSNKKGYEIITNFLFSKLSSATGIDYNIPWPLACKDHERIFQKACYNHLVNFSKENCVNFPRIVSSLLSTFGGDRFYETYCAFSSYVLYKVIKRNDNTTLLSKTSCSQENYSTAKEILQLSTVLNMKKFRETEMISYNHYQIWLKFAKILEESLKKLKDLLKSYDELITKKKNIIFSLYPDVSHENFNLSEIIEKCHESLKPVLKQRKILDEFLFSEQRYWQCLCSEIGENVERELLNGQDYKIQVSKHLPAEYAKELKNFGCLSSDENGKLSVEKFIKIFMAYVTFIVKSLKNANVNELQKNRSVENASFIADDLKWIKNLNKKLAEELIPDVKKRIEKLRILSGYDNIEDDLELSGDLCSLPNPSYDIETVKQRTSHFDADLEKILDSSLEKQIFNKNDDSDVFLEKYRTGYKHIFSSASSVVQNATKTSLSSFASSILSEGRMVTNPNIVPAADVSTISKIDIVSLDDPEFSRSTRFKMRESWLKEESLNSVSLPDISFDD